MINLRWDEEGNMEVNTESKILPIVAPVDKDAPDGISLGKGPYYLSTDDEE
jgi:hypothetical protein